MDVAEFAGWRDSIRLTDGAIELIVTTAGRTGGHEWRSYDGGRVHRPSLTPGGQGS